MDKFLEKLAYQFKRCESSLDEKTKDAFLKDIKRLKRYLLKSDKTLNKDILDYLATHYSFLKSFCTSFLSPALEHDEKESDIESAEALLDQI